MDNLKFQVTMFILSQVDRAWLHNHLMSVYARKSVRSYGDSVFDIASVEVRKPGKGTWSRFIDMLKTIDELDRFSHIRIENAVNPILFKWAVQHCWSREQGTADCFYMTMETFKHGHW